ncbi:MAG: hypothetical protein IKQ36_09360 [Clostridia bacterium]|nr:hypothetical protein [Clostridia bacterium]
MKLSKKMIRAIITVAVILVVYNVLAFVLPFKHNSVFWVGYGFGLLAILTSLLIFAVAFGKGDSAKSRFYGFPIARVGSIYATVQLILSFLAMGLAAIPGIPAWPFVLVFILLFAVAILGAVATDATRDEIERQDTVLKKDVEKIRELRSIGNSLAAGCENEEARAELKKLADALNYCDPVSNDATAEAEGELNALMQEIQRAIVDGDNESIMPLCKKAQSVLSERNRLCKLNK